MTASNDSGGNLAEVFELDKPALISATEMASTCGLTALRCVSS